MNKLKIILPIQLYKFIFYNFLNRHIKKSNNGILIPCKKSVFIMDKGSNIILEAPFVTNMNCIKSNGRSTIIRLDTNAKIHVKSKFAIYYGGDIICFNNSRLELGSGFCNSNIKIRCTNNITIGQNVAISHDVTIMDSDNHYIEEENYEMTKPVVIEDDVWIGTRATILKGVTIGKGSVVAAGAIVTHDVPPYSMVAGVPARVIKSNIVWKKHIGEDNG